MMQRNVVLSARVCAGAAHRLSIILNVGEWHLEEPGPRLLGWTVTPESPQCLKDLTKLVADLASDELDAFRSAVELLTPKAKATQ